MLGRVLNAIAVALIVLLFGHAMLVSMCTMLSDRLLNRGRRSVYGDPEVAS